MAELKACRVCLATDAKLFNIYKYGLETAYEFISGTRMSPSDGLPQLVCSYCGTMLLKFVTFQEKCRVSNELLGYALLQDQVVSTDYIQTLDRDTLNLSLHYTVHKEALNVKDEPHVERDTLEELLEDADQVSLKFEDDFHEELDCSDDEPLSNKLKRIADERERENGETKEDLDLPIKEELIEDVITKKSKKDVLTTNSDIEVILLSVEEQIQELQLRKSSVNYLNSQYKCELCYKGFVSDLTYRNHMIKHDPVSGPHSCRICYIRWADQRTAKAHMFYAHAKKYVCKKCNHTTKSCHKAKEHSRWHEGATFTCKHCNAVFRKSTSYLTHVRLRHPSSAPCPACGETFVGEYGLRMHIKRAHYSHELTKPRTDSYCTRCSVHFRSVEAFNKHLNGFENNACDGEQKPCIFCGENFSSDEDLQTHMKEHHNGTYRCHDCNRNFSSPRAYNVHYKRVHLGENIHKTSRPKSKETAICHVCGKTCHSKSTLMYHMRTHTGEKPFQCSECPKKFSHHQRLQIHIRTHTGERPFKCMHCPKAFKHKAALNRHVRVHTGIKPYVCSYCNKAFSQSNSMKAHVTTVHFRLPPPYRSGKKKRKEDAVDTC